jgi:hypothetical protein
LLLFGCATQVADAPAQAATPAYSKYSPPNASSIINNQIQIRQANETKLTLIKFHGNSQCISCTNLGKFANSTLENNFQKELGAGKVNYLDINAEADATNPYVKKYRPTHASLYLLVENADGEKFEELAQAWYYTGDETKYAQYLSGIILEKLG